MSTGKAQTEIACTISWISNWSLEQKTFFKNNLSKTLSEQNPNDTASLESLSSLLNSITLEPQNKEGPSVFECQIRIFNKWYSSWDRNAKENFLSRLKFQYPELYSHS